MCCWVLYNSIEFWVVIVYIIWYGNVKVGLGFGVCMFVFKFSILELDVIVLINDGGGGGFICEGVGEGFVIVLGNGGMVFLEEDVLIVICLVIGGDCFSVYMIGEYLIVIDGFLCFGRCVMGGLLMFFLV